MVGLGDTKKKIQQMIDTAENTYERLNELRTQVSELRDRVEDTSETVDDMERDLAEQRALLEALAKQEGLDIEEITADVHIEPAEDTADEDQTTGETGDVAGGSAAEPED